MKTCENCKRNLSLINFRKSNNNQKGQSDISYDTLCNPCRQAKRAYERSYYHKNAKRKEKVIKRANQVKITKKSIGKALIEEAKNKPCKDCGKTYPSYVMDLDHCRGQKEFTISHWKMGSLDIEQLKAEIAKCDAVCSNCHRIRTHNRVPVTGFEPV